MTNTNNVPTRPGWWYIRYGKIHEIVRVVVVNDVRIHYEMWGNSNMWVYPGPADDMPITWLGPAPMWNLPEYDPTYGDDRMCMCGHMYHRHFDTYDDMAMSGCKYCACQTFVQQEVKP